MADNKRFQIAGSILSADLLNLEQDVAAAIKAGIDVIHFDVMDFHFVPNLTFGPGFLAAMRDRFPDAVFDVHLMVDPVTVEMVDAYIAAGASWITFHPEACLHTERMLTYIRSHGVKAGIALNPGTAPVMLPYLWEKLDLVLVMSVNPGFGGQSVIPACLKKITEVKRMAEEAGHKLLIEVDGGVKASNILEIAQCGANVFVVGSAFFGVPDKKKALSEIHTSLGE